MADDDHPPDTGGMGKRIALWSIASIAAIAVLVACWVWLPGLFFLVAIGATLSLGVVVLPRVFQIDVRGPGYQYRDPKDRSARQSSDAPGSARR